MNTHTNSHFQNRFFDLTDHKIFVHFLDDFVKVAMGMHRLKLNDFLEREKVKSTKFIIKIVANCLIIG